MHQLNIQIHLDGRIGGIDLPDIKPPVLSLPIPSDPVAFAVELGLELIPNQDGDPNRELIARGPIKATILKDVPFVGDVKVDGDYEVELEAWVTSTDPEAQADRDETIASRA